MSPSSAESTPYTQALDLSEGIIVACMERSVGVLDPRNIHEALDAAQLLHESAPNGAISAQSGFVAVFRAGRLREDGHYDEVVRFELSHGHAIYGRKLLEGTAHYADGSAEGWRIQVDPLNMRWHWTRQPDQPHDRLVLRVITPQPPDEHACWQTGRGITAQGLAVLHADEESELLCIGATAKNSFRIETQSAGALSLRPLDDVRTALAGESGWDRAEQPGTEICWEVPPVALFRMSASWGLAHAVQDFQGRRPFVAADATRDFDMFYARMTLAAMPLYLAGGGTEHYVPLAWLAADAPTATLHDIAMACEFLPLADPRAAGELMRDTIDRTLAGVLEHAEHGLHLREAAELLLIAGRYAGISGDPDFLGERLFRLRKVAEAVLRARPEGGALPRCDTPEGLGLDPSFIAMCYAGLKRLAELEHSLAASEQAKAWIVAADAMRSAALSPYADGGLLHPARGTFIHCSIPNPDDPLQNPLRTRTEFLLRQLVLPCALGLMDDTAIVQRAYDWVDDNYGYATGRGGATVPPGADRGLYALLDVHVRQSHNIAGADRVLQLILDHAIDFGVPMLGQPYAARLAPVANFADAAPYIGLVIALHYGLDYTRQGWAMSTPKPLVNYPLTRVTGLRHRHATYSVTWQGRGRIKRVVVDGRTHRSNLLAEVEGEHEVTIYLG